MKEPLSGETIAKKRQHKVYLILGVSALIGLVFGVKYDHTNYQNVPLWVVIGITFLILLLTCLLYTSPSPRDATLSRMPSSA